MDVTSSELLVVGEIDQQNIAFSPQVIFLNELFFVYKEYLIKRIRFYNLCSTTLEESTSVFCVFLTILKHLNIALTARRYCSFVK